MIFITYSLIAHNFKKTTTGSRLGQIVEWLEGHDDGNCFIILDECHKAKNLVSSGMPIMLCACSSAVADMLGDVLNP